METRKKNISKGKKWFGFGVGDFFTIESPPKKEIASAVPDIEE